MKRSNTSVNQLHALHGSKGSRFAHTSYDSGLNALLSSDDGDSDDDVAGALSPFIGASSCSPSRSPSPSISPTVYSLYPQSLSPSPETVVILPPSALNPDPVVISTADDLISEYDGSYKDVDSDPNNSSSQSSFLHSSSNEDDGPKLARKKLIYTKATRSLTSLVESIPESIPSHSRLVSSVSPPSTSSNMSGELSDAGSQVSSSPLPASTSSQEPQQDSAPAQGEHVLRTDHGQGQYHPENHGAFDLECSNASIEEEDAGLDLEEEKGRNTPKDISLEGTPEEAVDEAGNPSTCFNSRQSRVSSLSVALQEAGIAPARSLDDATPPDDEKLEQYERKGSGRNLVRSTLARVGTQVSGVASKLLSSTKSKSSLMRFGLETMGKIVQPAVNYTSSKWDRYGDPLVTVIDETIDEAFQTVQIQERKTRVLDKLHHQQQQLRLQHNDIHILQKYPSEVPKADDSKHESKKGHPLVEALEEEDEESGSLVSFYWHRLKTSLQESRWYLIVDEVLLQRVASINKSITCSVVRPAEEFFNLSKEMFFSHYNDTILPVDDFINSLKYKLGVDWDDRLIGPARAFYQTARAVNAVAFAGKVAGTTLLIGNKNLKRHGERKIKTAFGDLIDRWDTILMVLEHALDSYLPIDKPFLTFRPNNRLDQTNTEQTETLPSPSSLSPVFSALSWPQSSPLSPTLSASQGTLKSGNDDCIFDMDMDPDAEQLDFNDSDSDHEADSELPRENKSSHHELKVPPGKGIAYSTSSEASTTPSPSSASTSSTRLSATQSSNHSPSNTKSRDVRKSLLGYDLASPSSTPSSATNTTTPGVISNLESSASRNLLVLKKSHREKDSHEQPKLLAPLAYKTSERLARQARRSRR